MAYSSTYDNVWTWNHIRRLLQDVTYRRGNNDQIVASFHPREIFTNSFRNFGRRGAAPTTSTRHNIERSISPDSRRDDCIGPIRISRHDFGEPRCGTHTQYARDYRARRIDINEESASCLVSSGGSKIRRNGSDNFCIVTNDGYNRHVCFCRSEMQIASSVILGYEIS